MYSHVAGVPFDSAPQIFRRAGVSDLDGKIPAALPLDGARRRAGVSPLYAAIMVAGVFCVGVRVIK